MNAIITCPVCEHRAKEDMPKDACVRFYRCHKCGTLLRPKPGDCCVFCSYSNVKCPSKQAESGACSL